MPGNPTESNPTQPEETDARPIFEITLKGGRTIKLRDPRLVETVLAGDGYPTKH